MGHDMHLKWTFWTLERKLMIRFVSIIISLGANTDSSLVLI
jgi:hypothetical protein